MATYVLVHGGHHGGWCYRKVARLLRKAGHEVYSPTLTGLGERRKAELREASRAWEIDTGHDLMISEPEKLTEMLLRLA